MNPTPEPTPGATFTEALRYHDALGPVWCHWIEDGIVAHVTQLDLAVSDEMSASVKVAASTLRAMVPVPRETPEAPPQEDLLAWVVRIGDPVDIDASEGTIYVAANVNYPNPIAVVVSRIGTPIEIAADAPHTIAVDADFLTELLDEGDGLDALPFIDRADVGYITATLQQLARPVSRIRIAGVEHGPAAGILIDGKPIEVR